MIASVGPGLPQDLLQATGAYSGPVAWDLDRATPDADRWLESKFPLWARSILQQWADGDFDHLEIVVFSRADDAVQRLYYYLCELQRTGAVNGPEALLLDIAKIPRPSSLHHTMVAVRRLAERLAADDRTIEASIAATNVRRKGVSDEQGGRACLIAGTPPPDRRLHDAIESVGFRAVGPTLGDSWRELGPAVDEGTADPLAAIARQLHARWDDQRGFGDQAGAIAADAQRIGAAAAVLWYTEEDESRVWNAPAARAALNDLGLPVQLLARRDWAARDGAMDEIQTFLRELGK